MIFPDSFEQKTGFVALRTQLKERCSTIPARGMVDDMAFIADYATLMEVLTPTAEMAGLLKEEGGVLPIPEIPDLEPTLASLRIAGTVLAVADLAGLRLMLNTAEQLSVFFATRRNRDDATDAVRFPALDAMARMIEPMPDYRKAIDRVMDPHGNILDSASPELADIRRRLRSAAGATSTIMRRVMARAVAEGLIDSDTAPTIRDGRLVIPVPPANKRRLGGIVHDESASGHTVFVEPAEVVEASNRQRELELEERREILRILAALTDMLRPGVELLSADYQDIAVLDFIRAKARLAIDTKGAMPSVTNGQDLDWYNARHPALEASLAKHGKTIVPLNIRLTPEQRILIISGPNAGGKSVCLKTVGCLQYMLQCGLLPPVDDNSHFGVFSDIFIDIGDDQSIDDDISTYYSRLRAMRRIVVSSKSSSMILIDEMGSGTEPHLGGAIAQAILGQLNAQGAWGIATTHFHNIKQFASETPGLVNGSMLYDRNKMRPTFQLSVGNPGSSFALEIAHNIGLPADIINKAKEIAGSDYINLDKYLLDIARDRRYWENKRTAIHKREKELNEKLQRYTDEAETLRHARREILEEARTEARKIIDSSNAAIEKTISDIRAAQAEKEATKKARQELKATNIEQPAKGDHPLLRKAPKAKRQKQNQPSAASQQPTIAVGGHVRLEGSTTVGTITDIQGKKATVTFGGIKTTVEISRLTPTNARPASNSQKAASFVSSATTEEMRKRQLSFKPEIDVRGMRADEALQATMYFIDDAIQFAQGRVRILHGTGTGALRQAIRQFLSARDGVRSAHDEDVRFGGAGITVVELS